MIRFFLGSYGGEFQVFPHPKVRERLVLVSTEECALEKACPGFAIIDYGEKGFMGAKFFRFGVEMHPTQAVQLYAKWIERYAPNGIYS